MKKFVLLAVIALATVVPVAAQQPPFDAEIDCDGVHQPGTSVPFTMRFENQTQQIQNLDTTVVLSVPGLGQRTLFSRLITLNPNQDRAFTRNLNLPGSAPTGNYQMSITSSNGTDTAFDTCSFNLVP